ncbi:MAG: DoxX family protein [Planctomycetota bacterium]
METALTVAQLFIAIAMVDVWILRYDKPLRARAGDAQTMVEEFRVYGLPDWFRNLTRVLKLSAAALLVLGLRFDWPAFAGGALLVVLMAGAVAMHVKVGDSPLKSVPATFFLALSGFVAYGHAHVLGG